MSLVNRLAGIGTAEGGRIPVAKFWACLYELAQGKMTRQNLIDYIGLDAQETTELDWIIGRYNAQPNATAKSKLVELMQVIFYLCETGVPGYTTNAEIVARINAI